MKTETNSAPIQLHRITDATKTYAESFAQAMIEEVRNGDVDAVQTGVKIKWVTEVLDRVYKGISDIIRAETEKTGIGVIELNGAKVESAEVGTKYDYSNDVVWHRIKAKMEPLEKELKEREAFLKAVKVPMEVVDEGTGEVVRVVPPIKTSTSSVKITLGK